MLDTRTGKTRLSKQEKKVLELIVKEYKNGEIAKELGLDEKTVSTYKLRLLTKLECKTSIGLYAFNQKYKLVGFD